MKEVPQKYNGPVEGPVSERLADFYNDIVDNAPDWWLRGEPCPTGYYSMKNKIKRWLLSRF